MEPENNLRLLAGAILVATLLGFSFLRQPCHAADDGSAPPQKPSLTRQLNGSAQDRESMGQSVKLLVPAQPPPKPPPPPPPPRPVFVPNFVAPTQQPKRGPLQSGLQQSGIRPPQIPSVFTPTRPGGGFGIGGVGDVRIHRPPKPRPAPAWLSQIDVVAEVEPYREMQIETFETALGRPKNVPEATQAVEASPMKAQELVLPGSGLAPVSSWEDWYKRVAKAIYDRWSQNTAGPGAATVSITVFNSHFVDERVVEFVPAFGVDRNVELESGFKQTALQSVKSLSGDELWAFPINAPRRLKKIVFEMELKHAVGETAGCKVIHLHNQDASE